MSSSSEQPERHSEFVRNLVAYTQQHRAAHWSGTFGDFIEQVLPGNPRAIARSSHEYMWDMIRWQGRETSANGETRYNLFGDELFGVDERPRARRRLFQGRKRRIGSGTPAAAAARPAVGRQVQPGDPAEARPRRIQPYRSRRAVWDSGLPSA